MSQKSELAALLSKRNANILDRGVQLQQELRILPRWTKAAPRMEFHSGVCLQDTSCRLCTSGALDRSSMSFAVSAAQLISTSGTFTPLRAFSLPPRVTWRGPQERIEACKSSSPTPPDVDPFEHGCLLRALPRCFDLQFALGALLHDLQELRFLHKDQAGQRPGFVPCILGAIARRGSERDDWGTLAVASQQNAA